MPETVGAWIVLVILGAGVIGWFVFLQGPRITAPDSQAVVRDWRRARRTLSWRTRWKLFRANFRGTVAPAALAGLAAQRAEGGIAALDLRIGDRHRVISALVMAGLALFLAVGGGLDAIRDGDGGHLILAVGWAGIAISEFRARPRQPRLRARLARSYALNSALARQHGSSYQTPH